MLEKIDLLWLILILILQLPFLYEVILQIYLQMKLLKEIPEESKKSLPSFPVGHKTTLFAPVKFQKSFWDYVHQDHSHDNEVISDIKKKLRSSIKRKIVFAILDVIAIIIIFSI